MSTVNSPSFDNHELVVFREDPKSGLKAIIAIHNTNLGPALGGCRMYAYANDGLALDDVLRLSRGMTYKSALAGLPLGGGKSVIIGDPATHKSRELLLAMGDFVDSLGGKYISAEDSGTSVADMKVLASRTAHVSGINNQQKYGGDPSPFTAHGVYLGILAALRHRRGRGNLSGVKVALQGAGAVGRNLISLLKKGGATVFASDVNAVNLAQAEALGAEIVDNARITTLDADVFSPCAMGGIINDDTVDVIRAEIVAGAANNQLAHPEHGERLRQRGILYAPDFVINAGGIIDVYMQRANGNQLQSEAKTKAIGDTLTAIFVRADKEEKGTAVIAEALAEERFLLPDGQRAVMRAS
ncbi:amino acid dehydrogenase [Spongiibacter taiwanensis]|uniref:Glu/Leu/Phe/Val family dehydrogenase n=1 Tax=Spongiibacter taiwanensis TaxID=1748242 RepID=UPI00203576C6|nr:Glu/Leu/Phe/Val dehydrogenase dimerization domain-containing protein [Spongiibacter taiwanensis]USA42255.1 amino acid dehydrogenase [Spongiibacter taiwanensis]